MAVVKYAAIYDVITDDLFVIIVYLNALQPVGLSLDCWD